MQHSAQATSLNESHEIQWTHHNYTRVQSGFVCETSSSFFFLQLNELYNKRAFISPISNVVSVTVSILVATELFKFRFFGGTFVVNRFTSIQPLEKVQSLLKSM